MHQQSAQSPATPSAPTKKAAGAVLRECGICQSAIQTHEQTTSCPSCKLVFHAECWQENWGCAAYGCEKVNALRPPEAAAAAEAALQAGQIVEVKFEFPWDYLILAASAFAALLSILTYGVPAGIALLAVAARAVLTRNWRSWLLALSAAVCITGIIAGVSVSRVWWTR